jgi:hypothetical protein
MSSLESTPDPTAPPRRLSPATIILVALAIAAGVGAVRLFPAAMPQIALRQRLTRDQALARATQFATAHSLTGPSQRAAVTFAANDSLRTFLELAGGGKDTLNAVLRGTDIALFGWAVRFFEPHNPREAFVRFGPDGRLLGFRRVLADSDARPAVTADSARHLADVVLAQWASRTLTRYRLQTSSYNVRTPSQRVDRTFTYERVDRRIGGAPLRTDVVIAGDLRAAMREYVVIPESFTRRYGEMRSANDTLALLAGVGLVAWMLVALGALIRFVRQGLVRWKPAAAIGALIGVLLAASGLNELSSGWFDYDTATSPATFQALNITQALLGAVLMGLVVTATVAGAEVLTRRAFPEQLDWWRLWRYRGTRQVAGRVFGGYGLALFGFLYVAVFYLVTQRAFGWWVPSEMLDDPNQIATPLPWLGGLALSLQAAVWEESLFRAVPLGALALLSLGRRHRRLILALGVVLSAVVFGFAHANYPSWPPYSRGIEIFLDASVWAAVYLTFGLPVTVVAHFLYDLVLFGLFAAAGDALPYRVTLVMVVLLALAPALAVAIAWIRQRRLVEADAGAGFGAWEPHEPQPLTAGVGIGRRSLSVAGRRAAVAVVVLGAAGVAVTAKQPSLGPPYSATRDRAITVADSVLRARQVDPAPWMRLTSAHGELPGSHERFYREQKAIPLAVALTTTYEPAAVWGVRYVRIADSLALRAEEWRVRLLPDGRPLDVAHRVPQDAPGDSVTAIDARAIAIAAVVAAGIDPQRLRENALDQTPRPKRLDSRVEYIDSTVHLPAGATARAEVTLTGRDVGHVSRWVELPESFIRADRARSDDDELFAIAAFVILLGATSVGTFILVRRRQSLVPVITLSRRARLAAWLAIAVVVFATLWNRGPDQLFDYDTNTPWSRFLLDRTVSLAIGTVLLSLFVGAVIEVAAAVRQRVGIPFLPEDRTPQAALDAVLGGLALALLPLTAGLVAIRTSANTLPLPPDTSLNAHIAILMPSLTLIQTALLGPSFVSLPLLIAAAFVRGRVLRIVMLVGAACALAAIASSNHIVGAFGFWATAAMLIVLLALWARAFNAWGTQSGASWLIAVLGVTGAAAIQEAVRAGATADRVGSALAAMVSALGIGALARLIARRPRDETRQIADARDADASVAQPGN